MANDVRVALDRRQCVADKDISALKVVPDRGLKVEAERDRIGIAVGSTHKVLSFWLPGDSRERWKRLVPVFFLVVRQPKERKVGCQTWPHADEGTASVLQERRSQLTRRSGVVYRPAGQSRS